MTVCQICGDQGYSKLLIRCVQCRSISVHRYCVLTPFFCEDEKIKWSCEFCDPCTTEVTEPTAAVPKPDRKKTKKKPNSPQSKKPTIPEEETAKKAEATDPSILDQKNADESLEGKQVKLKETGIPVLPHVSDATEVVVSNIEKSDNSHNDVNEGDQELPQSEGLTSTVEREAVPETVGKNPKNNLSSPRSKKSNVTITEPDKEAADQKSNDGSVKSEQVKLKEKGSSVLPHVSDATDHGKDVDGCERESPESEEVPVPKFVVEKPPHVSDATVIENSDNSNNDVDRRKQKLSPGRKRPRQRKHSATPKKGKQNKQCSDADKVKEQKSKNVKSSDATDPRQTKLQKSPVRRPASETTEVVPTTDIDEVDDSDIDVNECVNELQQSGKHPRQLKIKDSPSGIGVKTRSSGVPVKKKNIKKMGVSPKKTGHTDERGSGAKKLNKSSSKLNDHDNTRKAEAEETVVDCSRDHLAVALPHRDVSASKAPRKKRKVVIEVEYSDEDEDPVFFLSKHPQLVGNVRKDSLSISCSEAISKLSDDGHAQLSSIESIRHQSSPANVDNRVRNQESSVVFENEIPIRPTPINMVGDVPAQPLIDIAWRGYFNVAEEFPPLSLVLEAHLSNKAHERVQGAVTVLPELLDFVTVPKEYAWPKTYERTPPTADGIGLYFFPVDERAEKLYFHLVDQMASRDLVLKSVINNLELLVFCSVELLRNEWRFRRRYYLWGVFRPRQDLIMPNVPTNIYHMDNVQASRFRRDAEFSDHPEHDLDRRGRSDRRDRRSRRWNNSGRSRRSAGLRNRL